jgi:hypothetical protein
VDSLMYTCRVDHMYTQHQLALHLPERNYCVSRIGSVFWLKGRGSDLFEDGFSELTASWLSA